MPGRKRKKNCERVKHEKITATLLCYSSHRSTFNNITKIKQIRTREIILKKINYLQLYMYTCSTNSQEQQNITAVVHDMYTQSKKNIFDNYRYQLLALKKRWLSLLYYFFFIYHFLFLIYTCQMLTCFSFFFDLPRISQEHGVCNHTCWSMVVSLVLCLVVVFFFHVRWRCGEMMGGGGEGGI